MTRTGYIALLLAGSLTACSQATPEQQVLDNAAEALGGSDRVLAVSSLVIEGEGMQYNLGQDVVPDASGQTFTVSEGRLAIDIAGGRSRTELTRQPNFRFFQGPAAQRQITGIDGNVGYNVAPNGNVARVSDAVAADRRAELLQNPLTAVRAALDPMATVTNARTEGADSLVDVVTADGRAFTLAVDASTNLPSRVVSMGDNTNLGDVAFSATFAGYEDVGGLQLPTRYTFRVDDFVTAEYTVTSQTVDGDTGDLAAPADAASAAPVTGPPPATVNVEELANGIWYLTGGSHHSVLVEFSDHLMLIEAPQNDTRALAVINQARQIRPDKPLTQLVNSHHHFDHSGGVRAAISEGLTVITHEGNVDFFERMAARPHTIVADALATNPRTATVEGVADTREITDGQMTVNLYTVSGAHSETMLVAHFPRERLLVEADVYTPGANAQSFSNEFLGNIKARNLQIDRVVPLHGAIATYAQFVKEASSPPATN